MREIVDRGYRAEDEDRFLQLDMQFHLALARASGNPTVETLMRALLRQLEIARDMAMHLPLVPQWTIDIHERTLAAVAAGDPDAVAAVMDEHLGQLEETAGSTR
jgi:DNA-binding GntR family transcriptional regulator